MFPFRRHRRIHTIPYSSIFALASPRALAKLSRVQYGIRTTRRLSISPPLCVCVCVCKCYELGIFYLFFITEQPKTKHLQCGDLCALKGDTGIKHQPRMIIGFIIYSMNRKKAIQYDVNCAFFCLENVVCARRANRLIAHCFSLNSRHHTIHYISWQLLVRARASCRFAAESFITSGLKPFFFMENKYVQ